MIKNYLSFFIAQFVCLNFALSKNEEIVPKSKKLCQDLLFRPFHFGKINETRNIAQAFIKNEIILDTDKIIKKLPVSVNQLELYKDLMKQEYFSKPIGNFAGRFPDLRQAKQIRFAVLGDIGYGQRNPYNQIQVAKALNEVFKIYKNGVYPGIDFVIVPGDFTYDPKFQSAIRPPVHITPEEFRKSFIEVYPKILGNNIPFYVWPGNHETDPTRRIQGQQAMIDMMLLNKQYLCLNGHWGVPKLPKWIKIAGINTTMYNREEDYIQDYHEDQMKFLDQYFSQSNELTQNFLIVHHPPTILGKHTEDYSLNGDVPSISRIIDPIIYKHKINFVLAGHTHEQGIIARFGAFPHDLIIDGAGGANLSQIDLKKYPIRVYGEGDKNKLFLGHFKKYGFSIYTVNENGYTIIDKYGFSQGQSFKKVKRLLTQIYTKPNSSGLPITN
ncbi:MAG: metallophosphoesterase [Halobacteriovoraceae bacterium]|nr:metallophosphoesterase [Halobacteriovoraceae bacterium]